MIQEFKKGVRTPITKSFSSTEFDCKCVLPSCTKTLINIEHVTKLQELRDKWGSITITSGFRCAEHNKAIGGEKNSIHMQGSATDIVVASKTPNEVQESLKDWNGGLGRYKTFTHIDSRGSKARWDFR
jgi:uncharacterized protein YcbK (DUF882 family)